MRLLQISCVTTLLLVGSPALAAETFQHGLAQEPYTGLLKTPNAQVADYGQAQFDFSNPIERNAGSCTGP